MFVGRSFRAGGQPVCGKLFTVFLGLCCLPCGASPIQAQSFAESKQSNWHQWRGPEANGVSRTATPPIEWSEGKNIQWKIAIDGNGSSTPIIWGNKVFLLTAINTGEVDPSLPKPEDQPERVFGIKYPNTVYEFAVLCLDRDSGKELWRRTATRGIPHEGHHGDNDFASASPTTDGERLYCWFGSAGLFCYDLDGKKLWDRDLGKVFMEASLGEGCSPVVHDGKLVIVRDHGRQSTIEVLDTRTGAARWKADRDEPNAWATPIILDQSGKTQVVTAASNMVRSYDIDDGRIIWQCGGLTGNVIPSPVVEGDVVYCMSGYQGYALLALPLGARGDISNSDAIVWSRHRGTPYVPSPLLYNGMLYFSQSNQAVLSCVDSKTGETIMDRTRLSGVSNLYASPVGADGRIYITGRNGATLVLERSEELKVLARNELDDRFDASPALAGDQLFLRGGKFLYCIQYPLWAQPDSSAWNQFRGPNGSGVADDCRPPAIIDVEKAAWKVDVPPGHSSPVLSRQLILVTAIEDDRLVTLAFGKRTGELAWRKEAPEVPLERVHEAGSPAASTPTIDDGRVYVYFGSYGLLCYDLQGRDQWERPIPTPKSLYGTSSSPIVHGDMLILVIDNDANLPGSKLSQSKIIALDKSTGELVWEALRPFHRSGWSTPTIWTHEGGQELVVLGNGRLCGYDAATGVEKWYVNGFSRETISRPISGDGYIYASASMIGGVADERPDPKPFWAAVMQFDTNGDSQLERDEMTGHFTYPIRPDLPVGHPGYGMPLPKDNARREKRLDGMFTWIDKDKDGFWTKEEFLANISFNRGKPNLVAVRPGGEGDVTESHVAWALHRNIPEVPSPVLYRERIYQVQNGGILSVVDASNGRVVHRERLGATGHYRSSPVVANGHLYVISEEGIVSVVKTGDDFEWPC